ncbi:hypothetical protein A5707_04440 [Mycobacterium kyorinense]|uniref:Uncharacterized protein n=1 Tax=Mycobacterium kyorinense TaxID=487514 RepID=A0A1A2Z1Y1_9MYCO|nr:hypothetical protein [Mycobacterium kyorinense]OBI43648.1 hypothetical protein A5707_04440 [Mycobacterium kyorinense]
MARYGPPDNPSNQPTQRADYDPTAQQPTGPIESAQLAETDTPPTPWYRKRSLLAAWATVVAILVALIIYGLVELSTGGGGAPTPTTSSTSTTTTSPSTTTTTTTPAPSSSSEPPPPPPPPAQNAPVPRQPAPAAPHQPPHLPKLPPLPHIPSTITLPHTVITLPPGI